MRNARFGSVIYESLHANRALPTARAPGFAVLSEPPFCSGLSKCLKLLPVGQRTPVRPSQLAARALLGFACMRESLTFENALSRVVRFGVLVWEVLSYGELPYAEVANIDVQKRVKGGLRLKAPPGAYQELFDVAQSCWKLPKKV